MLVAVPGDPSSILAPFGGRRVLTLAKSPTSLWYGSSHRCTHTTMQVNVVLNNIPSFEK